MKILNKFLIIILGLLLVNLAKGYIWAKPQSYDHLTRFTASVVISPALTDNMQKKDWSYYSSMFDKVNMPVYADESNGTVEAPVNLVLRGTILSNPQESFAIIEDIKTGKQDLYSLGDTINGAKVVSMNRNRIILDCDGVKQELRIYTAEPSSEKTEVIPAPPKFVPKMNNIADDFAKILTQLRLKPYFEKGKCVGFQINNISNNFIKQMGLKDGDVIETINGVEINDPLKALQIIYGIEKNNPVNLGVERGKEKLELSCEVEG